MIEIRFELQLAICFSLGCLRRVTFFRKKVTKERKGLRALDPGAPVISRLSSGAPLKRFCPPAFRRWRRLAQSVDAFALRTTRRTGYPI